MTNNQAPLISVIIPAFNRSERIADCIDSVLSQSFVPYELIIVDDGSTDETANIVRRYANKCMRCIVQPKNLGAQAARNRGIREANGYWIAFQDSDDEWLPEKLEKQVEALGACGFDPMTVVHTDCWRQESATDEMKPWDLPFINGPDVYRQLLTTAGPMFPGILTSKYALEKICLLDEAVPSYQEWDTAIRLSRHCRFVHIRQPLFIYHLHQGETISNNTARNIAGYQYVVDKFRDDIVSYCGKETYNLHLADNACRAMKQGLFVEAQAILNKGLGFSPGITLLKSLCRFERPPSSFEMLTRWGIFGNRIDTL